ncbi:plant UBX domain-containing protein 7-like isoform X2 [Bidens hawaiensis]|uniref:plant UBX domain-containing protein 7-like isoform X2 n=1 Tax=Bidens hawaiensis TaxID=980011 RepID=UPI00404991CF
MDADGFLSLSEKQTMVSTFLEITSGNTPDTAHQFLQATGWQLEEAIQLFYVQMESGGLPPQENEALVSDQKLGVAESEPEMKNVIENDGSEVRAPLPVKRDILYDTSIHHRGSRFGVSSHEPRPVVPFRNFEEELKQPGVWGAAKGSTSAPKAPRENLASLYRPPFALMFQGPFEKAKEAANKHDRWLIVNVQSTREFSSHMLNRDTWANEAVSQTISSNFIFWQVFDDAEEGSKIVTYYKLDTIPVTLVIDPITGQRMRLWRGMIQPESLLEDLLQFLDASPKDHHLSLSQKRPKESSHSSPPKIIDETNEEDEEIKLACALSMEGVVEGDLKDSGDINEALKEEKRCYPPLPEEPKGGGSLVCRVGVRFPDGRRAQRNFFRADPIQLLWSFCAVNCGDEKPFRLTHAIPGAVKDLDYESKLTFEESGVANSMISVTWL